MSVAPERFEEFFRAVHGFDPFPWQTRLACRVTGRVAAESGRVWPEAMALPTGSGKTACLDIALFALACQSDVPTLERTAPRRILFVVDRRVIVDEAFEHSLDVAKKLDEALRDKSAGVLHDVAAALQQIGGDNGEPPLTCQQLRGAMYRDDAWARTPTQPCVICSTVDQIGSRLLFRSYGRSPRTWAVHAGLAGNDSLVLLDEAHCANPFFETMQSIARFRGAQWADEPLGGPFHFAILSATPPKGIQDVLRADEEDAEHAVLGRRLSASKPTALITSKAKGKKALDDLAVDLSERAAGLVSESRQAIAIFVNRVRTAKLAHDLLKAAQGVDAEDRQFDGKIVKRLKEELPAAFDVVLMTGRMRPWDRQRESEKWLSLLKASNAERKLERPVFVVATQCLEVGANLDFDGMVTECASLDALRQRFGRLNRMGRPIDPAGIVVVRADQTDAKNEDPIYRDAIAETWQWLGSHATGEETPTVDFGIRSMTALWDATPREKQSTLVLQGKSAPIMLPAYVDCWVQTAPVPAPDPEVSLFLHGPQEGQPEIQVCWRADLTGDASEWEEAVAAIALCPPTTLETLQVPLPVFQHWWQVESSEAEILADVDPTLPAEQPETRGAPLSWGIVWRGPKSSVPLDFSSDVGRPRPGDTVVLPVTAGGWNVFGHVPPGEATEDKIDIAEDCLEKARLVPVVRLCRTLVSRWSHNTELASVVETDQPDLDAVEDLLRLLRENEELKPGRLTELLDSPKSRLIRHPIEGVVVIGQKRRPERVRYSQPETMTTEDDSSSLAIAPITLARHTAGVVARATSFGKCCGLSGALVDSMRVAAELHDLGKADIRFQAMLYGDNLLMATAATELYAKSEGLARQSRSRKRRSTILPEGFRHELLSLSVVEAMESQAAGSVIPSGVDRDLVLHLIASHHGQCRPFADVVRDDAPGAIDLRPVDSRFTRELSEEERRKWPQPHAIDAGTGDRFWRLVRRYGWWGLAWIEAIFILADHRQSESETSLASGEEKQAEGAA